MFCLLLGENWCNKALHIQCNSVFHKELDFIDLILSKMNSSLAHKVPFTSCWTRTELGAVREGPWEANVYMTLDGNVKLNSRYK